MKRPSIRNNLQIHTGYQPIQQVIITPTDPIDGARTSIVAKAAIGGDFGLIENSPITTGSATYNYKYNGKELQDELGLNWTAMDFRNYDTSIGRFNVIDPMASFAPNHTSYRFGFNNPIFFGDPSGMYEVNTIDGQTNVILNIEEMKVYNSLLKNGNFQGLKGDDLVNAIVEGLESAGFSNNYTLDEVTVTASKQNNFSQFTFSNKCITGCHQTPGDFSYNNTPLFQKSGQTFYWHSGGKGGGFENSFMKPGDRVEMLDLLEWLSISRANTPSSMHTAGLADIFSLLQMWDQTGNTKNMIDAVVPIQAKDTILNLRVRKANSSYIGAYYIKGKGYLPAQTFYKSKDTLIHTTSDKVEKVQKLVDSISNSRL